MKEPITLEYLKSLPTTCEFCGRCKDNDPDKTCSLWENSRYNPNPKGPIDSMKW